MKSMLTKLSVADMMKEIKRRNKKVAALQRRHAKALKKLAEIEAEIEAAGGKLGSKPSGAGRLGKRPRNKASLPDSMARVMSKTKPMSVGQIEAAVLKSGYKSTSKTFGTIIYQTLKRESGKLFRKKSRGQYLLA